jgi:hypothetical protein
MGHIGFQVVTVGGYRMARDAKITVEPEVGEENGEIGDEPGTPSW